MASEQFPVQLVHQQGGTFQGVFAIVPGLPHRQCRLTFRHDDGEITGEAFDYFEAMCQIRNQLEAIGYRPACYGASRNVYPSGMARDMGRGLKAYKLYLGRVSTRSDLVGIFATGGDLDLVSVEDQRAFWKSWWKSLLDGPTFDKMFPEG
jgi:hypothetical protein